VRQKILRFDPSSTNLILSWWRRQHQHKQQGCGSYSSFPFSSHCLSHEVGTVDYDAEREGGRQREACNLSKSRMNLAESIKHPGVGVSVTEQERKKYMMDVYSTYWKGAREKIYGFSDYDRWLCKHIAESVRLKSRVVEVAIGTGFPLAEFLSVEGFEVCGADISSLLVRQCAARIGSGTVTVADAEHLCFPDQAFQLAYCFHSTWYFPNLVGVLKEMSRVTRRGGIVTFDILNCRNKEIQSGYEMTVRRSSGLRALPSRARILSRRLSGKPTNLHPVVHEVPTDPSVVYDYCRREARPYKVFAKSGQLLGESDDKDEHESESRLIFDITV
jgi:ubiquinone/menaquinone biosynthesis C-methylase UbiE